MKTTKTVRASRKTDSATKRPIRANRVAIRADEEEIDIPVDEDIADVDVDVDIEEEPVSEELLFEVADVAEIIAEVTGEPVDYTVDDETTEVTFAVGDDEITVTPEGNEEVVEESTRIRKSQKVAASRKTRR